MTSPAASRRRLAFGPVARLYEEARPSYPPAVIDSALIYAGAARGESILEVGAGTGKATRLFAARGRAIVALEPSPRMAAVARRACAGFRSVTLVECDFEDWEVTPAAFKLVTSAQAWHWTDPRTRYAIARRALSPGGAIAMFWNRPDWAFCPLRPALLAAYVQAAPGWAPNGPMHPMASWHDPRGDWRTEIAGADGFDGAEVRRYAWTARYTARQYVALLCTHSDHIVLEPAVRAALLAGVAAAIDAHGGAFELPYLTHLCLARAV